jgi:hypothetical protein
MNDFATPIPWAPFLAASVVRGCGPGPGCVPSEALRPRLGEDRRLRTSPHTLASEPSAEADHPQWRLRVPLIATACGSRGDPRLP